MKKVKENTSRRVNDNKSIKLENELDTLTYLSNTLNEFKIAMGNLCELIQDTVKSNIYEDATSKAEELTDTLSSLDEMYKSFFESGYLTQNIETKINNINSQMDKIFTTINNMNNASLQTDIMDGVISLNNNFDRNFLDISSKLTKLVNIFKETNSSNLTDKKFDSMESNIVNSVSVIKEDLLNEMTLLKSDFIETTTNTVSTDTNSYNNTNITNTSSVGFKKGSLLYYISELNNNKIHVYNVETGDESVFSEIINIDNEHIPYKNIPTSKICNVTLTDLYDYLLILTENKKDLNLLNFTTGNQSLLFKHCSDFIYHKEYLYALLYNKFVKYDISTNRFIETFDLLKDSIKISGLGEISIIDNLILIKIDIFSYIYNPVSNEIIKLS